MVQVQVQVGGCMHRRMKSQNVMGPTKSKKINICRILWELIHYVQVIFLFEGST